MSQCQVNIDRYIKDTFQDWFSLPSSAQLSSDSVQISSLLLHFPTKNKKKREEKMPPHPFEAAAALMQSNLLPSVCLC